MNISAWQGLSQERLMHQPSHCTPRVRGLQGMTSAAQPTLMPGAPHDGGEHCAGCIVSRKPRLHHSRPIVADQSRHLSIIGHCTCRLGMPCFSGTMLRSLASKPTEAGDLLTEVLLSRLFPGIRSAAANARGRKRLSVPHEWATATPQAAHDTQGGCSHL